MQIYDALPLLTAQPSEQDKKTAPHELYGILHPNKSASAGKWREVVEPLIQSILEKGQRPVIVGGSGLYIKSLIEGFSPIPDIPDHVRNEAIELQGKLGNPAFHAELEKKDPVMAARFHPRHTARLIRAWEVIEATGKSLAEWQKEPLIEPPENWVFNISLIMPDREKLYERCNTRFLQMMEMGVLEEVEEYQKQVDLGEINTDSLTRRALGLKPLQDYLQTKIPKNEAIENAQRETRQYAKRQLTWFRHQIKKKKNIAEIRIFH